MPSLSQASPPAPHPVTDAVIRAIVAHDRAWLDGKVEADVDAVDAVQTMLAAFRQIGLGEGHLRRIGGLL